MHKHTIDMHTPFQGKETNNNNNKKKQQTSLQS